MLCMACDADMMLMKVERNDTMTLLGCEHHAFRCSECQNVKWHLVFVRHGRESYNAPLPTQAAHDERKGFFRRLAGKIRGS
jgi:hypothetical protein